MPRGGAGTPAPPAPTTYGSPTAPVREEPGRTAEPWYQPRPESEAGSEFDVRTPRPQRRTGLWVGMAASVIVLALVATGLVLLHPWRTTIGTTTDGNGVVTAQPSQGPLQPVLSAAGADVPAPDPQAVAAVLQPPITDPRLGSHVAAQVVDVATGTQLYARGQAQPTTPASTTKLATAVSLLAVRGPAYRIPTRVVAGRNPGEVVLIGGGDPTLAVGNIASYPGAPKLSDLAAQVRKALGGVAPTQVTIDTSLFSGPAVSPQWAPDDVTAGQTAVITPLMTDGGRTNPRKAGTPSPRFAAPDMATGQMFAKLLGVPASAVSRGTAPPASGTAPASGAGTVAPGTRLGQVLSPPVERILEVMLNSSDNLVAEMMARQVALASNQPASFSGGASAVLATLDKLGIPTAGARLYDGSGLATADKLTPQLLVGILTVAARPDQPVLHGLFTGLPVAGYSGTLSDRYHSQSSGGAAAGEIRAKTGTLTGVNTLAGLVVDASGRLLAFAVMADHVPVGPQTAEAALDRVAAALAGLK